jgi:hypothetical protein
MNTLKHIVFEWGGDAEDKTNLYDFLIESKVLLNFFVFCGFVYLWYL